MNESFIDAVAVGCHLTIFLFLITVEIGITSKTKTKIFSVFHVFGKAVNKQERHLMKCQHLQQDLDLCGHWTIQERKSGKSKRGSLLWSLPTNTSIKELRDFYLRASSSGSQKTLRQ